MAEPIVYPKLGETRCYWVLLDAQFRLLFTDPVLTCHLKEQAQPMIGRSLLEFIHPDERGSASRDFDVVVKQQAIHGTVTRVKYLRLSQIRVVLGSSVKETFPHAAQVGFDQDYIPCDLVLNWVADNLALCFVHDTNLILGPPPSQPPVHLPSFNFDAAIIDISPDDNNELLKARWHWTNWCGTVPFSEEQSALLRCRLTRANLTNPHPDDSFITPNDHRHASDLHITSSSPPNPPRRVFQIHANSPARKVHFSWPPRPSGNYDEIDDDAAGEREANGWQYDPDDFSQLASNVRIDSPAQSAAGSPVAASTQSPSGRPTLLSGTAQHALGGEAGVRPTTPNRANRHQHSASGSGNGAYDPDSPYAEVKTSCTRRYQSSQVLRVRSRSPFQHRERQQDVYHELDVESIFIPHGSVIFACHQVVGSRIISVPALSTSASAYDDATVPTRNSFASASATTYGVGAATGRTKIQSRAWTLLPNPNPPANLSPTHLAARSLPPLIPPHSSSHIGNRGPSLGSFSDLGHANTGSGGALVTPSSATGTASSTSTHFSPFSATFPTSASSSSSMSVPASASFSAAMSGADGGHWGYSAGAAAPSSDEAMSHTSHANTARSDAVRRSQALNVAMEAAHPFPHHTSQPEQENGIPSAPSGYPNHDGIMRTDMDVSMDVDVDVDMDENMMSMGSGTGAASTGGQVFRSSARNPRMDLGTITSDDSFRRSGVSNYSTSTHNPPYPSSLPPLHRLPDHGPHPYVLPPLPPPRDTDVKSYPSSVSAHLQSLDHRPSYPWAQGSQGHTPQQAHLTQDSSYPPHPAALGLSEPQGINTPSSMNPSLHGPLTGPGHHQSTSGGGSISEDLSGRSANDLLVTPNHLLLSAIPSGMYSNHPSAITTSQPNAFAPAAAPRSRNNTNSGVQSKRVAEMAALSSARLMGTPPAGVTQCAYCGTTSSPEWRKGETGIKNLCNACGLRFARTKQKEEGHVPTRRRVTAPSQITAAASSSGSAIPGSGTQSRGANISSASSSIALTGQPGPSASRQYSERNSDSGSHRSSPPDHMDEDKHPNSNIHPAYHHPGTVAGASISRRAGAHELRTQSHLSYQPEEPELDDSHFRGDPRLSNPVQRSISAGEPGFSEYDSSFNAPTGEGFGFGAGSTTDSGNLPSTFTSRTNIYSGVSRGEYMDGERGSDIR